MRKFAIVVAGGSGLRMGTAVPKQFLPLGEHPVLWYTLETFLTAYADISIILVIPAAYRGMAEELSGSLSQAGRVELVEGGNTRFHSVRNGLERIREKLGMGPFSSRFAATGEGGNPSGATGANALPGGSGPAGAKEAIIFVHDGVRCLASPALVRRCYEQAVEAGSAVPVVDCRDSVRLAEDEGRSKPIDRSRIKLVQTPQTFRADILIGAYAQDHQEAFTDEAIVVEIAGHPVRLIEGDETNIKITTPADLIIAERLLALRAIGPGP